MAATGSGLIDRTIVFVGALRQAGLPVSLAESLDAARALAAVPLLDREAVRAGFAATMCKRPAHRLAFDTLFDLYFPPAVGDGAESGRRRRRAASWPTAVRRGAARPQRAARRASRPAARR